jgi:hypothetical protein
MIEDFQNWSFQRCKELALEYQKNKDKTLFCSLLARFDRYILHCIHSIRKKLPRVRGEEMQELYHTGIVGFEKGLFGTTRFARDVAVTSKMAPLKGASLLGAGALFGAATAGTEEPVGIAKAAGKNAAIFGAINAASRILPGVAKNLYERLPQTIRDKASSVGQSIGMSLGKIANISKLKLARHSDITLNEVATINLFCFVFQVVDVYSHNL